VRRSAPGLAALALVLCLQPALASGAAVKIWVSDTAADFSAGEARGISVAADGTLLVGRTLARVEGVAEPVLFAAAQSRSGDLFVATGDSGKILRVSPAGKVETEATLAEQEVTALAIGPDGAVYAGASPGGKVYRVERGKASLYYDTKARYVWALAFSGSALYVGTGLPGEIHRVVAMGKGERVHATPDEHVRALFADGKGRIWAGTSGSGLVLRIEPGGRVVTVYDSAKPEITAIAADRSGRVWAAAGAAEIPAGGGGEPLSVPVALPAPKAPRTGGPSDDEDRGKAEVTVSVSSARPAPARSGARGGFSSEVVVFEEGEPPRAVWTSADEIVFDLGPDEDGPGVLAATGPKGKLYAVAPDASALVRTFDEKQVTVLAGGDVGTNVSSALYRGRKGPASGEYVSAVKDTGRTSRFGAFRWEGDAPPGSQVEFSFRSGESAIPDTTWSPWSAWAGGHALEVAAPDARFVQWRVRMASDGAHAPSVRRTEAAYRNRNTAPVIESLVALEPAEVLNRAGSGGSNVLETSAPDERGIFTSLEEPRSEASPRKLYRKGYRTLQWKASDPDGDALVYEIEFRPVGGAKWIPLKREIRDTYYSFDATSLPDGEYVFRLSASDADANPGEGKTGARESAPVRIDNTPPVIRQVRVAPGLFEFEAHDLGSPIVEAEYSVDAKKWVRVEPKDGLSDSMTESYTVRLAPEARGGYLLVRVTDGSRNVAVASFTAP